MHIPAKVNFEHCLQEWDGFGINYVETAQTPDYRQWPQEYGGFSTLSEEQRQQILQMIFGEDGLKPGVFKMFIDSLQQDVAHVNHAGIDQIDQNNYDHQTTTAWMRYFIREGMRITRERGGDMQGICTLYGPPAFMTKTKQIRGRDMDPQYETECAKYIVSFAKYMREEEHIPINWLSIHNEGEDFYRWPEGGMDNNFTGGHDYNMYWSPEHVASFLPLLKAVADANCPGLGVTPGECTGWTRFAHWGYANAIAEDPQAMKALGLITSHGFYGDGISETFSNSHADTGITTLRGQNPSLHAWVTSTSWKKMDARFAQELHRSVYDAKVNAVIPWAAVQLQNGWLGGDPNPGCAFSVKGDGTYTVENGYWYYKPLCRIGQPGMRVAAASCAYTPCSIIAFSGKGTCHPDAFAVINADAEGHGYTTLDIRLVGEAKTYAMYRTSSREKYVYIGKINATDNILTMDFPANSVTALIATE